MNIFEFQRNVRDHAPKEIQRLLFILSTYHAPGSEVRPSVARLAKDCGYSTRHTRKLLARAEEEGWSRREFRVGLPSIYHLQTPVTHARYTDDPGHTRPDPPVTHDRTPRSPTPSKETREETREETKNTDAPQTPQALRSAAPVRPPPSAPLARPDLDEVFEAWDELFPGHSPPKRHELEGYSPHEVRDALLQTAETPHVRRATGLLFMFLPRVRKQGAGDILTTIAQIKALRERATAPPPPRSPERRRASLPGPTGLSPYDADILEYLT